MSDMLCAICGNPPWKHNGMEKFCPIIATYRAPAPLPQEVAAVVERLTLKRQVYNGRGTFRDEIVNPDGREAADLIDRLASGERRMREALEKIASCESHHPADVVSIARAALAPGDGRGE